jgi:hypothetical protein
MILDYDGNAVVADTPLITDKTATTTTKWTMGYLDVDSSGKAHITWCDSRDGDYLVQVYYTSYQGPACPAPPSHAAVPTLSQSGIIAMGTVFAGFLVWVTRKRQYALHKLPLVGGGKDQSV